MTQTSTTNQTNSPNSPNPKGPWIHRFSINLFTIIFAILVFWTLGFFVEDIESIEGPDYATIESQHVDPKLLEHTHTNTTKIAMLTNKIAQKHETMRLIADGSRNLQKTISQLTELKRLSIQKSITPSDKDQTNLANSLTQFLDNQKLYQRHNTELSQLIDQKRQLESQQANIRKLIKQQQIPAQQEFDQASTQHYMYLAYLQLLILLPLLLVGAFLVIKYRASIYFPFFLGYGGAILLKISLVIHEYFPARYVKYILIFGLLLAVSKLLVYFIQVVASPKAHWLIRQYMDAYQRFLCPVCEYPIRTGPRKFLFWTRRTVNKLVLSNTSGEDSPYTCPACGTKLLETCNKCQGIRHSLLPYCQHCNAKIVVTGME